jgi:hypothetical protein
MSEQVDLDALERDANDWMYPAVDRNALTTLIAVARAAQQAGPWPLVHEVGGFFWCCHCHAGNATTYLIAHDATCGGIALRDALVAITEVGR